MRVLLLDNHDSFSAILGHYLWELAGEKPLVYRNDELTREELESLEFDAAVISPGPGHPAKLRDFGICRDLLQLFPDKPVLGVCLGHQGLAHFSGASVVPVPGALHGRPGHIRHSGTGVFRGLPLDFEAIRYHSLAVEADSLPSNVEVTAVSVEDGRVMGIAFKDRPWHGVQFHPESIGTPSGRTLLANFLDIADPDRIRPSATFTPKLNPEHMGTAVPFLEISWRDPAEVFTQFFSSPADQNTNNPFGTFWLDGSHRPFPQISGWAVTVMGKADRLFEFKDWPSFRKWVEGLRLEDERSAPWPGYRGGPVGQLSYELYRDTLQLNRTASAEMIPESLARWMLPEGYLVFDHAAVKTFAAWEGSAPPHWLQEVLDGWGTAPQTPFAPAELPPFVDWKPVLDESAYTSRVRSLQDSIARGDTYEACLTNAFTTSSSANALAIFLRLRNRNPSPYAAFLSFPDTNILSASPELFLEMSSARVLRSRPIKGTRPRGATAEIDQALRTELRHSEKDGAENRMIVDLTRHDFCRVCALGSVHVPSFLEVEAHPAVFQMVSEVSGILAVGETSVDAVAACFPGGSMTGAPKERTVELLFQQEAGPRGVYSGALGWFTRGGQFTLSMVIRTLENRGDQWRIGCGGAILADSNPESEWRESMLKARSVIDAASA